MLWLRPSPPKGAHRSGERSSPPVDARRSVLRFPRCALMVHWMCSRAPCSWNLQQAAGGGRLCWASWLRAGGAEEASSWWAGMLDPERSAGSLLAKTRMRCAGESMSSGSGEQEEASMRSMLSLQRFCGWSSWRIGPGVVNLVVSLLGEVKRAATLSAWAAREELVVRGTRMLLQGTVISRDWDSPHGGIGSRVAVMGIRHTGRDAKLARLSLGQTSRDLAWHIAEQGFVLRARIPS